MKAISQYTCFVAISCLITSNSWAQTKPASDATTQELLDQVRVLRSEVTELRAKVAAPQLTTQPSPAIVQTATTQDAINQVVHDAQQNSEFADMAGLTAGYTPDKGFIIRSDDGKFLLHPWVYMQFRDATNYRENATAATSDTQNGFELPRMKFILDGNAFSPDLTYQFIWATSDTTGDLGLQDAWARYHIPNTPFALEAGQIRDPVDHEQIMFATKTLTPGRSIVNNVLLNGDDIVKGASVSYGYDGNNPFRSELAFTSGERNFDTNFEEFPTNAASGRAFRIQTVRRLERLQPVHGA